MSFQGTLWVPNRISHPYMAEFLGWGHSSGLDRSPSIGKALCPRLRAVERERLRCTLSRYPFMSRAKTRPLAEPERQPLASSPHSLIRCPTSLFQERHSHNFRILLWQQRKKIQKTKARGLPGEPVPKAGRTWTEHKANEPSWAPEEGAEREGCV